HSHRPRATLFPYTTLFRSRGDARHQPGDARRRGWPRPTLGRDQGSYPSVVVPRFWSGGARSMPGDFDTVKERIDIVALIGERVADRKSTRLNSSHGSISYA